MIYPTHCEYSIDEINHLVSTDPDRMVAEAEGDYQAQLQEAVTRFFGHRVLCLAGPSGSGKTTTANKLAQMLTKSGTPTVVLSMDDFYKNHEDMIPVEGKLNFEVIEALEIDLLQEKIHRLLQEGSARLPRYDFQTGLRSDDAKFVTLPKNGAIVIEGIHGLNEEVSACFAENLLFRVYISPHSGFQNEEGIGIDKRQVRLVRRMIRDHHHRDTTPHETLVFWEEVCRAEDLYVRPMARFADYRINSVHLYEPCLFRDEMLELLDRVPEESKYHHMTENLKYSLRKFRSLPMTFLPKDSLLREFTKN